MKLKETGKINYFRVYAYTTKKEESTPWKHRAGKGKGLIKIGMTRDSSANTRIRQQFQGDVTTLLEKNYIILIDEESVRGDGTYFKDHDVHRALQRLGACRIAKTEWFECTLAEVKDAIDFCKTHDEVPVRKPLKEQDVVENRGYKRDPIKAKEERQKLLQPSTIIDTIREYPNANSNVKLASKIIAKYNITQYAQSTVSIIIGPVVNKLIECGTFAERSNSKTHTRELFLQSPWALLDENVPLNKRSYTKDELLLILLKEPSGYTTSELSKITGMPNNSIIPKLDLHAIKVYERSAKFNGIECRWFHPSYDIVIPKNDKKIIRANYNIPRKIYTKVCTGLKGIGTRRTLEDIKKLGDLDISEERLAKIISMNDYFNSRFAIVNNVVYRKGPTTKKILSGKCKGKAEVQKYIEQLLKEHTKGLSIQDLCDELPEYSYSYIITCITPLVKASQVYRMGCTTKGTFKQSKKSIYIHKDNVKITEVTKTLSKYSQNICIRLGLTEEDILFIVDKNPGVSTEQVKELLHTKFPEYSINSFNNIGASILRELYKSKKITNLGSGNTNKWYLVSEECPWVPKGKYSLGEVLEFVKSQKYGATIREIFDTCNFTIPIGSLGVHITKSPLFHCVKVFSEGISWKYRVFSKGQPVLLPEGELAEGYGI